MFDTADAVHAVTQILRRLLATSRPVHNGALGISQTGGTVNHVIQRAATSQSKITLGRKQRLERGI